MTPDKFCNDVELRSTHWYSNLATYSAFDISAPAKQSRSGTAMSNSNSRVVFVGNVPYNMTEEQLVGIFKSVGQVIGFRLVFDRDTAKPKGYGFCEFADHETALSAVRNLNNTDCGGRPLRIDLADSDPFLEGKTTVRGEILDGGYPGPSESRGQWRSGAGGGGGGGRSNDPDAFLANIPPGITIPKGASALDHISRTLATLPESQVIEVLAQMKAFVITHPDQARTLLIKHPQLAYALFQSLLLNKIVDPNILERMLASSRGSAGPSGAPAQPPPNRGPLGPGGMPPPHMQQQHMPPVPGQYPPSMPPFPPQGLQHPQPMPAMQAQPPMMATPPASAMYGQHIPPAQVPPQPQAFYRPPMPPAAQVQAPPPAPVAPQTSQQPVYSAQMAAAFAEMDPEQQRAMWTVLGMTQEQIDNTPEPAKSQIMEVEERRERE
ncbi:Cleavage stimulation factor subunit 2 [Psilocybe cubensis]|uniref:Cleavage stimulation factor subunit 2 n=2 Tax=Psilocybe cubensis TaxID=181762 RepID=A0ACB8GHG7_PSICU|nr:Cleavage stimulation factor subunit 2 [Psilocybe cubensis]KAH9474802.1 Cleavage stimulation factor subunit 2 [Psilocybe cubensis]